MCCCAMTVCAWPTSVRTSSPELVIADAVLAGAGILDRAGMERHRTSGDEPV
jgi:hypothetical protein